VSYQPLVQNFIAFFFAAKANESICRNKENQLMIINQKDVQEAYLLLEKKYGYLIEVAQSV